MKMCLTSAAVLAGLAGSALGQVTVDGSIVGDEGLYQLNWINNQPTSFGDNQPQEPQSDEVENAVAASTGLEFKIPLAELADDMGDLNASIRFIAFINGQGHDFVANQVTGGLGDGAGNPGEPRLISWAASSPQNPDGIDGTQTLTASTLLGSTAAPVFDGAEDAAYGSALFVQNTGTGFGNSDDPSPLIANGSEINEAFAAIVDENDDGLVDSGDTLYLLFTGNVESNFNKFDLFIDSAAGGQNAIRGDNPDVDFNGLNRMGDDGGDDGLLDGADLGMQFEAGFEADYWITYTTGDAGGDGTTDAFLSGARLLTEGAGPGGFLGGSAADSLDIVSGATSGEFGEGIEVAADNSNVSGVGGSGFVAPAPDPDFANGSELNALYSFLDQDNDVLNVLITGNLESNFNRFYLFVDADPNDGQAVLRNDNLDISFDRLNRMGSQDFEDEMTMEVTTTPGLTFDAGFAPDYVVMVTTGNNPVAMFIDAAVLRANGPLTTQGFVLDYGSFDGGSKQDAGNNPVLFDGDSADETFASGPVQTPSGPETPRSNFAPRQSQVQFPTNPAGGLLQVALDNSNVGGITDAAVNEADAAAATTGLEFSIDFSELLPGGQVSEVKFGGFLLNDAGFFVSNQVLGGLPAGDELGEVSEIDFTSIDGDQFVSSSDEVMVMEDDRLCADQNGDGQLLGDDFNAWLLNFLDQSLAADVNQDGQLLGDDFNAWLLAFLAGEGGPRCPAI
ncbi:MAG: hypothetical protein AAF108_05695 [Planctomycetota bacterium]